jgi:cytochrome d ubiquinol oxidase subunit II
LDWLLSLLVGFFTVALFAYLAAVYLILETEETPQREDFCKRALFSGFCVVILQLMVLGGLQEASPIISERVRA